VPPEDVRGVQVVATDSPGVQPTPLQWRVSWSLTGVMQQPPSVVIDVPAGGVVDLATVVPSTTPGVVTVVSEQTRIDAEAARDEAVSAAADAETAQGEAAGSAQQSAISATAAAGSATTATTEAATATPARGSTGGEMCEGRIGADGHWL
jgi:hypothetical protein